MAGVGIPIEVIRFTPKNPTGALILIHGWGEAVDSLIGLVEPFASIGYDTVAMSMRGWGRSGGVDDCGLHQPDDVIAIAEEIRSWPFTSKKPVYYCGISQGGQVALLAAARQPSLVTAVAAWAPVTDVGRWRETTSRRIVDYIARTCVDGDLEVRSPLAQAHRLTVPVLLVHGDADNRVPIEQSQLLNEAIDTAGGRCTLDVLHEIGHGGPQARKRAFAATTEFFDSLSST